jgi:hypothetical protein
MRHAAIGCAVLIYAEAYDEAEPLLDTSIEDAQHLGSLPHFIAMSQLRSPS